MKASDHRKVTRKAVQIFDDFAQTQFSAMLLKNVHQVAYGADKEDTLLPHTRATNWHFFKQNELLQPAIVWFGYFFPLPVTPTSDRVLRRRIRQLQAGFKADSPGKKSKRVGRVLHHVQDMSTPAHVVPVYHGPEVRDSFEDYSPIHIVAELAEIEVTKTAYTQLCAEQNTDILAIYKQAAHNALHHLYDDPAAQFEINDGVKTQSGGWDLFWKPFGDTTHGCAKPPYKRLPGFGCYGPLGQAYGKEAVKLEGKPCIIRPEVYRKLHGWVLREQVLNSLRTLMAIVARNSPE